MTKLLTSPSRAAKQAAAIAERIMQFGKPGNGLLVAERDKPIACLAWTLTPALHRPLSGRIATIIVDEKHRREGVGRALIEAAAALMAKAGCESVEAMSDIDIRSAHGFFRKLGFAETSYRFARSIAAAR
ncbi:GNAT family N-acetyltransferase [Sphingopyxis sp. CCNWLW2]|uniref:GNAT family N-acetyltransferase n=1 Tax=Sphingopyxis sp. CCNWLW2 TaxID=3126382 RepID=UPI0030131269